MIFATVQPALHDHGARFRGFRSYLDLVIVRQSRAGTASKPSSACLTRRALRQRM
jgi:hypothetical protein